MKHHGQRLINLPNNAWFSMGIIIDYIWLAWPQIYYYTFVYLQHLSFLEFTLNFIFLFDPHTYGHVMIICQCSHMARREKMSFNIFLWWTMNQAIAFAIEWDLKPSPAKKIAIYSHQLKMAYVPSYVTSGADDTIFV